MFADRAEPVRDRRDAGDSRLEAGIDVFKMLSRNLNAWITVNTDFAETEVDEHVSRRKQLESRSLAPPDGRRERRSRGSLPATYSCSGAARLVG